MQLGVRLGPGSFFHLIGKVMTQLNGSASPYCKIQKTLPASFNTNVSKGLCSWLAESVVTLGIERPVDCHLFVFQDSLTALFQILNRLVIIPAGNRQIQDVDHVKLRNTRRGGSAANIALHGGNHQGNICKRT